MHRRLGHRIVLREVDELVAFPSYSGVAELLQPDVEQGSCEVVASSRLPASDWYPEAVGLAGGDYLPPWWAADPVVTCRAVNLIRVRDAFYMPALGIVLTSSGEVLRSSVPRYRIPTLDSIPGVSLEGDTAVLDLPQKVPVLDSAIVSMPWAGRSNYGHFVLNCLPTLALAADTSHLSSYARVFPELSDWQRRHLALLGVTSPVELQEPLVRISDLVLSNCMSGFLHQPNVTYRLVRDLQLARCRTSGLAFEKIYISRQRNIKRPLRSEQLLEQRLRNDGFAVVAPEEYSIDEQIRIFRAARLVVGCAGAAFANVIYCQEGSVVVEITPSRMVDATPLSGVWVYYLCALMRCKWRPYYTSMIHADEAVVAGGVERRELGFSFDIDLDDLMDSIRRLTL